MRSLFWLVGGVTGIAGSIGTGCSSSSSPSDGGFSAGDATEVPSDAAPAPGDACVLYDADLSFVNKPSDAAGADCAVCLVDKCQAAIDLCQGDCLCNNYFACVAYLSGDAGVTAFTTCAGSQAATLASNAGFAALYSCYTTTCANPCVPPAADAATDAAAAGGG